MESEQARDHLLKSVNIGEKILPLAANEGDIKVYQNSSLVFILPLTIMSRPIQDEKIQAPEILDDTKAEYAQDPQAVLPTDKPDYTDGLRKSRFDSLTVGQTLWIFKRLVAYMMCTYSLTLIDMWQVSH